MVEEEHKVGSKFWSFCKNVIIEWPPLEKELSKMANKISVIAVSIPGKRKRKKVYRTKHN